MSVNSINNDIQRAAIYAANAYSIDAGRWSNDALCNTLAFSAGITLLPYGWKLGKGVFWDGPKWLINNRGDYTNAWNTYWAKRSAQNNAMKNSTAHLKGKHLWNTVNNRSYWNELSHLEQQVTPLSKQYGKLFSWKDSLKIRFAANRSKVKKELVRKRKLERRWQHRNVLRKAKIYKDARVDSLINEAKYLQGKELKAKLKEIEAAKAQADLTLHKAMSEGIIKPPTKWGRAWYGFKKYTGINAVNGLVKKGLASKNVLARGLAKGVKSGGPLMAVFSLAMETPNLIKTYKTCGTAKGNKELAKTGAVVAAETVGYAVGAKVGGIAGAKIGAGIGTFIGGPIGTAIGAAVGGLIGVGCGIFASHYAGKRMRKLVGKSELDKHNEEVKEKLAKEAKTQKGKLKLIKSIEEQYQKTGEISEEDAKAYERICKYYQKKEVKKQAQKAKAQKTESKAQEKTFGTLTALQKLADMPSINSSPSFYMDSNNIFNPFMPNQYDGF